MDGRGHMMFAPFFTCLGTSLLATAQIIPITANDLTLTVGVATAISLASAKFPDADQIALKPKSIILGTAKKRFSTKYQKELYYVTISEREFIEKHGTPELSRVKDGTSKIQCEKTKTGKYLIYYDKAGTKNKIMLVLALMFKAMGLKRHRGWQSHSPFLWFPALFILTMAIYALPDMGIYMGLMTLGLSMGFASHIIGDMFTKDGVETLPDFFGAILKFLPKGLRKKVNNSGAGKALNVVSGAKFQPMKYVPFAKSGSKGWTIVLCFAMANIFAFIFLPLFFHSFWSLILGIVVWIVDKLWWALIKLKDMFLGLMG